MVGRVFNLVYREIKGLHQAAYVLGLFAIGSQLLAIVRDRLLAHTFGAGIELDLYYTAFRIPDLLFVLFASVLSVYVLLPFVEQATNQAKKQVLAQVFTVFLVLYTVFASVLAVLAPWYVPLIFPGLATEAVQLTSLLQVLLLQPLLLGLSSLCGVITQAGHRFVLYALSPILYNVGIIIGIVWFYPALGLIGLAYGVVLGAMCHLLVQLPYVWRSQLRFGLVWQLDRYFWGCLLRSAIPRSLTLALNQLVMLLFVGIATTFALGSVSVFQLAYNIQSVPLAIIGLSYSVAAFPTLSHLFAAKKYAQFRLQVLTAMRHIIFWSLPIIGLVVVLRAHIVRVLLGSGQFDWSDTRLTAAVLAVFVVSLVAQALLLLLIRTLYASGRTLVPLLVGLVSSAVAVAVAYGALFVWRVAPDLSIYTQEILRLTSLDGAEIVVLAVAFAVGQLVQLLLLLLAVRYLLQVPFGGLARLVGRSVVATGVGSTLVYLTLQFVVEGVNQETLIGITLQGAVAAVIGIAGVWLTYRLLRTPELTEIVGSFQFRSR